MTYERTNLTYRYTSLPSYTKISEEKLTEHAQRVQKEVIPKIKAQVEAKENGAQRLRTKGLIST